MNTLFRPLLLFVIVILLGRVCLGQVDATPPENAATRWKALQLVELDRQIALASLNRSDRDELLARKTWLENWKVGRMAAEPTCTTTLPKLRTEPILNSSLASELRPRLNWASTERDKSDWGVLDQALAQHPNDIGLQQLYLHWMDLPIRRKSNLKQIDAAALRLIQSLEGLKAPDATTGLALEFAMYRRGRALAYQELPDVVQQTPIANPQKLNQEILSAHQKLTARVGSGRSEFILLEIRILRRAKLFGTALGLVEKYGSVIQPKWYLKKRRDLLKELQWDFPFAEAANIYADEFPAEVAREAKENAVTPDK